MPCRILQRVGHSFELLWYFFLIFFEDRHEHEKQQFFFVLDVGIYQTGTYPRGVRDLSNRRAMIAVDREALDGSADELFAPPFNSIGVLNLMGRIPIHCPQTTRSAPRVVSPVLDIN